MGGGTYVPGNEQRNVQDPRGLGLWRRLYAQLMSLCLEKLRCELETTDWEILLDGDVNSAAELITDYYHYLITTDIPTKQVKICANTQHWIMSDLKKLILEKIKATQANDTNQLKLIQKQLIQMNEKRNANTNQKRQMKWPQTSRRHGQVRY